MSRFSFLFFSLALSVAPAIGYGQLDTNMFAKSMCVRFDLVTRGVALTNFPALVKLSTAIEGFSYADFSMQNGGDLRFADANGNLIPHEIDTWNPSGVSTVWVRVPRLVKNGTITAYYGCTGTPPGVEPKDVWDDDYVGVWHLGERALPLKESSETSSNFATSTGSNIGYAAAGIVGGSVDFCNGPSNALVAADHDALDGFDAFTIETWTYQDERKANAGILSKRQAYNREMAYYIFDQGTTVPICVGTNRNSGTDWTYHQVQSLGEWTYLVFSVDMTNTTSNVHGFKNGVMSTWVSSRRYLGNMCNCVSDLCLGNLGANARDYSFNGRIDEVRISKTTRSPEWIRATYDTIAEDAFASYLVGGELLPDVNIADLKLKARTDKDNPIGYVEGEDIRFDFFLDGTEAFPAEIRAKLPAYVIWERTADDGVKVKGTNAISIAQGFSVTTRLAIPGIVRMTGTLVGSDYKAFEYYNENNEKKNITFGGGAGVATEKMSLSTVEPSDFSQFWADARAKLAAVPFKGLEELTEVFPASSATNTYRFYAAKVPCFGPRPVTGWLTVPKTIPAGGIPVQANFAGYGCVSAAPAPPTYGAGQKICFSVNAHGYDMVGQGDQYYKDFNDSINKTNRTFNGVTYGYALAPQDYDNPTNTYFYHMAMRVMRAFDYLKSRSEWNGRDVIAAGGSQGGLQTMWAGGLVEGITQIQPSITWGCDIGDPFGNAGPLLSRTWGIPNVPGAYYFDAALHAKRVPHKCIAEITRLGMGDYTCPPRGVLLSYYNMECAVSAKLVQGSDHGYVPPDPNQTFTISKAVQGAGILYVDVGAGATNTLDAALVTEYVTNIVKRGEGTLVASAIDGYMGQITVQRGVFQVGVKSGAGKDKLANTIYVGDGASLEFTGTAGNILDNKVVVLEGASASGAVGKFISNGGWVTIGSGMSFELRSDAVFAACRSQRMILSNSDFDLGGNTMTVKNFGSNQASFNGCIFRNGGHIVVGQSMTFMHESGAITFETPSSGSPSVTLMNSAAFNLKGLVSAAGWTLYATNSGATVTGNATRWPGNTSNSAWDGRLVLGRSAKIATYAGTTAGVSNNVFNVKGEVSGSGTLAVGPGWLNLHTAANTYSGAVTVTGQSAPTALAPILPGGGGIGLWGGATCFTGASSVTFNDSARLAFMDGTRCTVGTNVVFAGGAGDVQSVSGGVHAARSTMGGFTKTGAGTLLFDSPVEVTGRGDVRAGTLKVANSLDANAQSVLGMLAPQPVFSNLAFAAGTRLDLSGNIGFVVANLAGAPSVTNSGVFGVKGCWTLPAPGQVLSVVGEGVMFGEEDVSGMLGFADGATFSLSDEAAFSNAVAAAGGAGIVVARANWVFGAASVNGIEMALPRPAAGISGRWRMFFADGGNGGSELRLRLASASGYAAWKETHDFSGEPGDLVNGIPDLVRYAFGIEYGNGPSEMGEPIIAVVFDAAGNPCVAFRELAEGRDDVTVGLLATERLGDWSGTSLIPMRPFGDGLWKPVGSEDKSYEFPRRMFFRYWIDVD